MAMVVVALGIFLVPILKMHPAPLILISLSHTGNIRPLTVHGNYHGHSLATPRSPRSVPPDVVANSRVGCSDWACC